MSAQDIYKTGRPSINPSSCITDPNLLSCGLVWPCCQYQSLVLQVSGAEVPWRQPVSGTVSWLSSVNSAHPTLKGRVVKVWGQQGAIKGQERSRALIAFEANITEVPISVSRNIQPYLFYHMFRLMN